MTPVRAVLAAQGGSLDPHGPVARAMEDLWWLMLWLGVAAFVLFAVLLALALRGPAPAAGSPAGVRRWIVGAGVVQPAVLITIVFAATLVAMRATPTTPPDGALEIEVVARQFGYTVTYPEAGVTDMGELHLPVGRPVALRLRSADVIHSFWVPELGGKLDMMPDGETTLVLEADTPGEFLSRCAEFCGIEHANMQLRVFAHPEAEFTSWLEGQR